MTAQQLAEQAHSVGRCGRIKTLSERTFVCLQAYGHDGLHLAWGKRAEEFYESQALCAWNEAGEHVLAEGS